MHLPEKSDASLGEEVALSFNRKIPLIVASTIAARGDIIRNTSFTGDTKNICSLRHHAAKKHYEGAPSTLQQQQPQVKERSPSHVAIKARNKMY